jgi:hypothetical protein
MDDDVAKGAVVAHDGTVRIARSAT